MASKNSSSLALYFALNILFFTFTTANNCGCNPCPLVPNSSVPSPLVPSPSVPSPSVPITPSVPSPSVPISPSVPCPNPGTVIPPIPVSSENCPIDTLKLGVCADVLDNLHTIELGHTSSQPCCSLIHGLIDLDAACCFCTALKANVLGMNIDIPISLSVLLNFCNKKVPYGFECP